MTETGAPEPDTVDSRLAEVGALAQAARVHALMTQAMLADALGVTQTAVSYWEAGKRDMGITDLLRLAEAVHVRASSLLPGEHRDPEPPLPDGIFARVELPGYRQHTGWVTEEARFGQQMAVVRNWDGAVTAMAALGPGCLVVVLPTPQKRPDPPRAITAWRPVDESEDTWGDEGDGDDD